MPQTLPSRIWLLARLCSSSSLPRRVQTRLIGGRRVCRSSNCGLLAVAMRRRKVPLPSPLEMRAVS